MVRISEIFQKIFCSSVKQSSGLLLLIIDIISIPTEPVFMKTTATNLTQIKETFFQGFGCASRIDLKLLTADRLLAISGQYEKAR